MYLTLHRAFEQESGATSRNLWSDWGEHIFKEIWCLYKQKELKGKKELTFLIRRIFPQDDQRSTDTRFSMCNSQFREVCEYHKGSSRIKCQDLSELDSAQRNQKENLRHCWHFQDCINNCVASLMACLLQGGIFVCSYKAAAQ